MKLGPVAHLVGSLIVDPGFVSSIPARRHTFVEINHETFSAVILLIPLIQEGLPKYHQSVSLDPALGPNC